MFYVLPLGPEREDLEDAARGLPWVTLVLTVACLGVYLALVLPATPDQMVGHLFTYGFVPGEDPPGLGRFVHPFLHGGFWHLLSNLVFLVPFGVTVERRLGHLATLVVFLAGGVAGALAYAAGVVPVTQETPRGPVTYVPPLFGFSGPLMACAAGLLPAMGRLRIRVALGWAGAHRVVPVQAWKVGACYLLKEGVFLVLAVHHGDDRTYLASLGGLGAGLVCGLLVRALGGADAPAGAVGKLVGMGRESSKLPQVSRTPSAEQADSVPDLPPAAPAPVPAATRSVSLSSEEVGGDLLDDLDQGEEDEVDVSMGSLSVPSEIPLEVAPMEEVDAPAFAQVSQGWAESRWQADLQERIRRAREMERDPERGDAAFDFYRKVLADQDLPDEYRTYAGARAARMLLRRKRYRRARDLAIWLSEQELPEHVRKHAAETRAHAEQGLVRREMRRQAGGNSEGAPT